MSHKIWASGPWIVRHPATSKEDRLKSFLSFKGGQGASTPLKNDTHTHTHFNKSAFCRKVNSWYFALTCKIIPGLGYVVMGSTPIYKPWSLAIWKGSHNPILRDILTMVINYVSKSWDDPPSTWWWNCASEPKSSFANLCQGMYSPTRNKAITGLLTIGFP